MKYSVLEGRVDFAGQGRQVRLLCKDARVTEYQRHGIIMDQMSHEICKYCNQIVLDSAAPNENKEICQ